MPSSGENPPPHVCGIVSMGTVSYKTLCLFEQAVLLLSRDCSVSKFLVASKYGDSEYIYLLNQLPKHAEITVVTPSPAWTGPSPFPFPLPYQNVEALGGPAAADPHSFPKALLSRSDYCICNLPPNLRHIKAISPKRLASRFWIWGKPPLQPGGIVKAVQTDGLNFIPDPSP